VPALHGGGGGVKRTIRILALAIAASVMLLDQVTKPWLLDLMAKNPGGVRVTPFFDIVMVWNRGISFGLFNAGDAAAQRWILIGLSLVIVAVLLVWLWRAEKRLLGVAIGLVVGGAIGNVVDRLRFGAVADFLSFHLGEYYWPAFNVADAAIVCGVGLLLLDSLWPAAGKR